MIDVGPPSPIFLDDDGKTTDDEDNVVARPSWFTFYCHTEQRPYYYEPISGRTSWSLPTKAVLSHLPGAPQQAPPPKRTVVATWWRLVPLFLCTTAMGFFLGAELASPIVSPHWQQHVQPVVVQAFTCLQTSTSMATVSVSQWLSTVNDQSSNLWREVQQAIIVQQKDSRWKDAVENGYAAIGRSLRAPPQMQWVTPLFSSTIRDHFSSVPWLSSNKEKEQQQETTSRNLDKDTSDSKQQLATKTAENSDNASSTNRLDEGSSGAMYADALGGTATAEMFLESRDVQNESTIADSGAEAPLSNAEEESPLGHHELSAFSREEPAIDSVDGAMKDGIIRVSPNIVSSSVGDDSEETTPYHSDEASAPPETRFPRFVEATTDDDSILEDDEDAVGNNVASHHRPSSDSPSASKETIVPQAQNAPNDDTVGRSLKDETLSTDNEQPATDVDPGVDDPVFDSASTHGEVDATDIESEGETKMTTVSELEDAEGNGEDANVSLDLLATRIELQQHLNREDIEKITTEATQIAEGEDATMELVAGTLPGTCDGVASREVDGEPSSLRDLEPLLLDHDEEIGFVEKITQDDDRRQNEHHIQANNAILVSSDDPQADRIVEIELDETDGREHNEQHQNTMVDQDDQLHADAALSSDDILVSSVEYLPSEKILEPLHEPLSVLERILYSAQAAGLSIDSTSPVPSSRFFRPPFRAAVCYPESQLPHCFSHVE